MLRARVTGDERSDEHGHVNHEDHTKETTIECENLGETSVHRTQKGEKDKPDGGGCVRNVPVSCPGLCPSHSHPMRYPALQ